MREIIFKICKTHRFAIHLKVATDSFGTPLPKKKADGPHLLIEIYDVEMIFMPYWMKVSKGLGAIGSSWQRMMPTDPPLPIYIKDTLFKDRYTECLAPLPMAELVAKLGETFARIAEDHEREMEMYVSESEEDYDD